MRRFVALVSATILIATLSVSSAAAIPGKGPDKGEWVRNPVTHHYYALVYGMEWPDAEARAEAVGGHLVTINDAAEEAWLEATFPGPNLWIGLNDAASEGTFVWSSGQPVTYLNWIPGEPDDWQAVGGEDYTAMNGSWNGMTGWIDADGAPFDGIIEVDRRPTMPANPRALVSLVGNFDLIDGLSGELLGHASVRLATPTARQLVPGSFDFVGAPSNPIRESHAQIGNVYAWYDPGHEGGSNVVLAEGVECIYFAPNQTGCHTWAAMFIDVLDPSRPNQVAFAIERDPTTGDWLMNWWQLVGKGSFVLTYTER
jgi:hypothetical protein